GDRREIREWCTLDPRQRTLYESALATFRAEMAEVADSRVRNTRQGRVLALLTELKEICDSAALVEGSGDADGGKVRRLDELLDSIFDAGESCLVFTQYARMGRLLRAHLQERFGRRFPFLHGGLTPGQREEEIAAFNADPEPNAFILSLKAGGFGLNLTRATHVIHFDRWWNPAVENQATDRAHRIGQFRDVFVHLFICAGTLEEHVDDLLETKRRLAGEIVGSGESFLLKMSEREFERMVSLDGE
ncbi:MAG: SWF/SNF helicase family protein, partial [Kiritimatiellae bacterium]|nr:SWF/SNF helicase family protein [Kiritimatiellia bacterium]